MKIFVENLSETVTMDDVKITFEEYGRVNSVILSEDNLSGIVEMPLKEQAITAFQYINDTMLSGNKLSLNVERQDSDRRESSDRRSESDRRELEDRRDSTTKIEVSEVVAFKDNEINQERRSKRNRRQIESRRESLDRRTDEDRRT